MSARDREKWDRRYATSDRADTGAPSSVLDWLSALASPRPGAVALDVACGLGRNAFLLARRGYRVVAADISRIALLTIDRELASGAEIQCVQFDADGWPFAPECFDLVVQISFLDRRGLTDLRASVRPHGLVLLETFVGDPAADRPGPRSADHRLKYGELARIFGDWEVLRIEERSPPDARAAILVRRPFLDASVR